MTILTVDQLVAKSKGEWNAAYAQAAADFFASQTGVELLFQLQTIQLGTASSLMTADLSTPLGLAQAMRKQGEARGMQIALEQLMDLINIKEDKTNV